MSLDDFRDDDAEELASEPQLFYGSADEFVRERLRFMYSRRVGGGNASFRWSARWWEHPEALARIDALWRAWEHLRLDGATGASTWWIEHADHHMPILMSPEGPFAKSEDKNNPGDPLPYAESPDGLFPDMRGGAEAQLCSVSYLPSLRQEPVDVVGKLNHRHLVQLIKSISSPNTSKMAPAGSGLQHRARDTGTPTTLVPPVVGVATTYSVPNGGSWGSRISPTSIYS